MTYVFLMIFVVSRNVYYEPRPMPSMEVCESVLASIKSKDRSKNYCLEVKP